jgi:hypothetical protein
LDYLDIPPNGVVLAARSMVTNRFHACETIGWVAAWEWGGVAVEPPVGIASVSFRQCSFLGARRHGK